MADNELLYVGCVVVTLKEVCVCGEELNREGARTDGARFCVRAAVGVTEGAAQSVEECLSERVNSSVHSFKSDAVMERMAVPVMLLCFPTVGVVANGGEGDANGDKAGMGNLGDDVEDIALGLELFLDINFLHGETVVLTVRRRVAIESLESVASQNCGVAVARVSAEVLRMNGVFGGSKNLQTDPGTWEGKNGCKSDEWSGLELHVIVRSMDMSEPIRLMLAAEQEAHSLLCLPQVRPQTVFLLPLRHRIPYSELPLELLYKFYCHFYERIFNKPMKVVGHVVDVLCNPYVAGMEDPKSRHSISAEGRWNGLRLVDFRPLLLGEDALTPILATLFHCPALRELLLDQNGLSDMTCYRIRSVFYRHRHLETLSIARNNIHEGGGEQLVRLLRRNKRLTNVKVSGNYFSQSMLSRIERVARLNKESIKGDAFNIFSAAYAYAVSPTAFPADVVKQAMAVWTMLSAAPVSAVMVDCVPNSTFGLDLMNSRNHHKQNGPSHITTLVEAAASNKFEGEHDTAIPHCALSPLLNEVMRTVALRMSSILHDPWALLVFSDIESHWERCSTTSRKKGESGVGQKMDVDVRGREEELVNIGHHETALCEVEDLYAISFLRLVVVTMRAVGRMMNWQDASSILRSVGKKQIAIGILEENYRDAVQFFVQSLVVVCGKDEVDVEHSAAFLQCLALGVKVATKF